jgi:L-ribulose-5-phosphate 4-epimerase
VLVAHHGPFTWGSAAEDAVINSIVLEACAAMATHTWRLTPSATGIDRALLEFHYLRKHGPGAYYGQDRG